MKKYYTISEVAEKLKVNPQTLRRWDKGGKFKTTRHPMNNYRVYTESQLENLVKELNPEYEVVPLSVKQQIEPLFETKFGKLYKMDAIQFLKSIPANSVDVVFADPPYNIKKAEWDTFESQKEYIEWSLLWIKEASRILKPTGSLFVCGFSEILADIKWSSSHMFAGCKWLVWFYRNKANLADDWGRSHESILHFRKSRDFFFNVDEARVPYNEHTLKYPQHPQAKTSQYGNGKSYLWSPHPKGAKPKDVIEVPTIANGAWERYEHPTQKPIELLKKIVLSTSDINQLIVDPFGGSGTTYAVAEAFKRKWMGSELNSAYCKVIAKRLSDVKHIARISDGKDEIESQKRRVKLRG